MRGWVSFCFLAPAWLARRRFQPGSIVLAVLVALACSLVSVSSPAQINVALQANGGVASASSSYASGGAVFPPSGANDGDRLGLQWGNGGGWNDATTDAFPDWLQITFSGVKSVSEIDVFTVQDAFTAPVTPTLAMTFTQYGITAFEVQY